MPQYWLLHAAPCARAVRRAPQTWLPDSPRWLLLSGAGRQAAATALARARGRFGSDAESVGAEIAAMERAAERSGDSPGAPYPTAVRSRREKGRRDRAVGHRGLGLGQHAGRRRSRSVAGHSRVNISAPAAPMRLAAAVAGSWAQRCRGSTGARWMCRPFVLFGPASSHPGLPKCGTRMGSSGL